MNIDLRLGDCIEVLKTLPDNSVDSIVTDPPYHLTSIVKRFGKEGSAPAQFGTDGAYARASKGFMGKEWDGGDIAFRTDVWSECLRILKPGGHLLAFSHSRTYHRMAVAVEDSGFEIRDQILWIYGQGFPKSLNIGKALDKVGIENELHHLGTSLKPAHEPIVMARKPLSEKSIAENVLKHGTGGINIDGSRIEYKGENDTWKIDHSRETKQTNPQPMGKESDELKRDYIDEPNDLGRFPANIIFDEEAGQLLDQQSGISKSVKGGKGKPIPRENRFAEETINERGGFDDKGGASRYFFRPNGSHFDFFNYIYLLCGNILEKQQGVGILNGVIVEVEKSLASREHFMCGNKSTEEFQKDMKSTISILIERMTELKTYDFYQRLSIDYYTQNFVKTIEKLMELNVEDASAVESINHLTDLILELVEHIKVIVKFAPNQNYKNGENKIENDTTSITNNIENQTRFKYQAKASKKDRNEGIEITNQHPTVKPTDLMRYLINLITPPNGVVLDPFMGSGSTGKAAVRCGLNFIGIEKEEEYMKIAEARINHEKNKSFQLKLL